MSERDRREFASRTPVNENTDRVVYRRGFVTRHQVSGWRFVMRRIALRLVKVRTFGGGRILASGLGRFGEK